MNWFDRNAERLWRWSREAHLILNGQRWHEFVQRFDSLEGQVTKAIISLKQQQFDPATIDSLNRLRERQTPGDSTLAVVTALPPEQTGIALASMLTFREAQFPVDIFCQFEESRAYLTMLHHPKWKGTKINVYSLGSLPYARGITHYRAQLFVIGNSHHNLPIAREILQESTSPSGLATFLQVHDPVLLSLFWQLCQLERWDFKRVLGGYYRDVDPCSSAEDLLKTGVYGLRALVGQLTIRGVIVHSDLASDMVARELPGVAIHQLFLPAYSFKCRSARVRRSAGIRIGTFGIPNASKRTEFVVQAFRALRLKVPTAKLIIAGFRAAEYANQHNLTSAKGFEIRDGLAEPAFEAIMQSVDLAIQLRSSNFGENSGAISQLLSLGVPVLTSKKGAFQEYKEAVSFLADDATAQDLADFVLLEHRRLRTRVQGPRAYARQHSPREFCHRLNELLEDKSGRQTDRKRDANRVGKKPALLHKEYKSTDRMRDECLRDTCAAAVRLFTGSPDGDCTHQFDNVLQVPFGFLTQDETHYTAYRRRTAQIRAQRTDILLAYGLLLQRAPELEALEKAGELSLFELVHHLVLSEEFASSVDMLAVRAFPGDRRIFHIHIPKTAGSSLHAAFHREGWCTYKSDLAGAPAPQRAACYETFTLERIRRGMLIGGHRTLDSYIRMCKPGDVCIAFVRDPLERILSHYNYLMTRLEQDPTAQDSKNMLLAGFVADDFKYSYARTDLFPRNIQCGYFCPQKTFSHAQLAISMHDVQVYDVEQYPGVVASFLGTQGTDHENVSSKYLYSGDVSSRLREKIRVENKEDYLLFESVAERLRCAA
jgi:hypothetical protein